MLTARGRFGAMTFFALIVVAVVARAEAAADAQGWIHKEPGEYLFVFYLFLPRIRSGRVYIFFR